MKDKESKETILLQLNAQRKGVAIYVMWMTVQEERPNAVVVSESNKKRAKEAEWMTDVAVRVCGGHEKGVLYGKGGREKVLYGYNLANGCCMDVIFLLIVVLRDI